MKIYIIDYWNYFNYLNTERYYFESIESAEEFLKRQGFKYDEDEKCHRNYNGIWSQYANIHLIKKYEEN
ncbi:hypothetical protein [Staphylococcus agnetis]|uniref:Phage protein n=1 Tax=Staphylococcus agnetis TaxID=985762 RepID=A0ABX3Z0V6_9STAP|nr:hypothetical protein [Staphylococcus agnetis]MDG4943931.1 hypothetical protein [Staphylococcus agnetis]OSP22586.1 hypothetical protein B9L42_00470 [Staphylococcus agnetis]OSP23123.1 hypothetical protein B9M87_09325 [Staphylococcus agnetis]OTW30520.1 hypothetical protein B9M88_09635 [Staphylococcus agnetis]